MVVKHTTGLLLACTEEPIFFDHNDTAYQKFEIRDIHTSPKLCQKNFVHLFIFLFKVSSTIRDTLWIS